MVRKFTVGITELNNCYQKYTNLVSLFLNLMGLAHTEVVLKLLTGNNRQRLNSFGSFARVEKIVGD